MVSIAICDRDGKQYSCQANQPEHRVAFLVADLISQDDERVDRVQPPDPVPTIPPKPAKEKPSKDRPLVVYAYSESDAARQNLEFFVKKGIHGAADFIFIFNGETNATALIPELPNTQVVERPNTCYDLGAIGEVLRKDGLWKKYKKFITMNASLRGPFIPVWSAGCWTDLFLNRVTATVKVRKAETTTETTHPIMG